MRFTRLLATLGTAALLTGAGLATSQAANAQGHDDYITVAWTMPSWNGDQNATWPQKIYASQATQDPELGALDDQLACGYFQIDIYKNNDAAKKVIAKGRLDGSGEDSGALIPGGWGTAYKLVKNLCSATPTQPTAQAGAAYCDDGESTPTNGTVTLADFPHGHWTDATGKTVSGTIEDVAPGDHVYTAVADYGYTIKGSPEFTVTVPESTSIDCSTTPTQPTAEAGTPTCVDGTSTPGNGTVTFADFEHGHWTDASGETVSGTLEDVTPGDHVYTAVADEGYRIDGPSEFTVTVPSGTPADCALPLTPTTPSAQPAGDVQHLASTGSSVSIGWILGGVAAFGAGVILLLGGVIRRRVQQ